MIRMFIEFDNGGTEEVAINLGRLSPHDQQDNAKLLAAVEETIERAWPFLTSRVRRQFRVSRTPKAS